MYLYLQFMEFYSTFSFRKLCNIYLTFILYLSSIPIKYPFIRFLIFRIEYLILVSVCCKYCGVLIVGTTSRGDGDYHTTTAHRATIYKNNYPHPHHINRQPVPPVGDGIKRNRHFLISRVNVKRVSCLLSL